MLMILLLMRLLLLLFVTLLRRMVSLLLLRTIQRLGRLTDKYIEKKDKRSNKMGTYRGNAFMLICKHTKIK
jgi:hypothetical protein